LVVARPRAHADAAGGAAPRARALGPARAGPTTLAGLEGQLAGAPAARDYVRKLRLARYAGAPVAPTRAERAALRDELAAGLGARGRLRAIWALPPRLRRTG
jgi:hypothetical protein